MVEILVSKAEQSAGCLSEAAVQDAVAAVRQDGFVVLLGSTQLEHVDRLHQRMLLDRDYLDAAGHQLPELRGNQPMPRDPAYLFPDMVQNPFVAQILIAVMGPEPSCGLYSSNVSLPGCGEQLLHVDMSPRLPDVPTNYACNCMVVNTALVDFTVENGATEVWPGSHLVPPSVGAWLISPEEQTQRASTQPPARACMPRGGVLLRDIRLWHRGPANHTAQVRPMVAQITNGAFRPGQSKLDSIPSVGLYPEACRPIFETGPIHYNPQYTSAPINLADLPVR